MKLSKYIELTNKVNELSKEIRDQEPPKKYILVWESGYNDHGYLVEYFYTKKEMDRMVNLIVGSSDPKNFNFIKGRLLK